MYVLEPPLGQEFKKTSFGLVWRPEGRGKNYFQIFGMLGYEDYDEEIAAGREVKEIINQVYCVAGNEIENLQIIEYEHSDELGLEVWRQWDPWFWGDRHRWGPNPLNRKLRDQIIFKRAVTETELARKDNPSWDRLLEIRLDMYAESPVHLEAIRTIQAGFREARARRLRATEDSDAGWSFLEADSDPEADPNQGQNDRDPDANADDGDADRELGADTTDGDDDRETGASEASLGSGHTTDSDSIQEETTDTDSIQEEDSNDDTDTIQEEESNDDAQSQPRPDSDDDALDLSFTSEEEKDDNSDNGHEDDNENDHETEHENEGEHENDNEYDADVDTDAGPDADFDTDTDSDNDNEQFDDPEPNAPRAYPERQPRPMREVGAYGVRVDQRVGTSQNAEINAINRNRLAASTADSTGARFTPSHYDFAAGGPREQDFEDEWEENSHATFQLGAAISVTPFTNAAVYTAYLPVEVVQSIGHKLQGTTMLRILVPKNFGGLFTGYDGENINYLRFGVEGVERFILVDFNQKLVIAMRGKDRAMLMLRTIGETIRTFFAEVTRGKKVSRRALLFMKSKFNQYGMNK